METSMMGARAGMDFAGYEVGEEDTRLPIDNITSTVPTSLSPNGFSIFSCTVASSAIHTLKTSVSGIYKTLTQISSSTLGIVVQLGANDVIVTTAGSSFNQITFAGVGHTAGLYCASTGGANAGAVWISGSPASPGLSFSTF
jgi:sorbitol-specific phosphotransferase system component IIA